MRRIQKEFCRVVGERDQRGAILIEVLLAAIISAIVFAAIAFYFVFQLGTVRSGHVQMKLQRTGTLVIEELARTIRTGRRTDLAEEGTPYNDIMITFPDASTRCFRFASDDISAGPDYDNLVPLDALDDSQTVGSRLYTHRIVCDNLVFTRDGDTVIIRFTLRHDMDNGDDEDDLAISFGSTVKLRG